MERLRPEDIAAARRRVVLPPTPLLSTPAGVLALECLQRSGSYKVRGATNAVSHARGPVVCASAGNHAAGLACAGRARGIPVVAVVPHGTPMTKRRRIAAHGARVIIHGEVFEESEAEARRIAERNDWRFVHPFDDLDVIAGQGTLAYELLRAKPDVVICPIGGGGLASGIGVVLRAHGVRLVGAQVEGVDAMRRTLAGREEGFVPAPTIADGVRVRRPGQHTRRMCRALLEDIVLVTESEVRSMVVQLYTQRGLVVEGAGAVAAAALPKVNGRRKLAVLSGGNIDRPTLFKLVGGRTHETRYSA